MSKHKEEISAFIHCKKCLEIKPDGMSPQEWSDNEMGWTKKGFQVWCVRHKINVLHIDFLGQKVNYGRGDQDYRLNTTKS